MKNAKRRYLGTGKGIFDFEVRGKVVFVDKFMDRTTVTKDKIIVTINPSPDIYFFMKDCAGVVSPNGSLVSHLAIIGIDMNVPVIVGVHGISDLVNEGDEIIMISSNEKGEVYATE